MEKLILSAHFYTKIAIFHLYSAIKNLILSCLIKLLSVNQCLSLSLY